MVDFLQMKFNDCENSSYVISEINYRDLEVERAKAGCLNFATIDGSSDFQVIVFKPGGTEIMASPRLCVCDDCKEEYGSCLLFRSYFVHEMNITSLRSSKKPIEVSGSYNESEVEDFLVPSTICAIAADDNSHDLVWFPQTIGMSTSLNILTDDYDHIITPGQEY